MGNFRQHVNRKRKEREKKRNRKNAKQKFKGEHGRDPMKSIAKALSKTLVISSPQNGHKVRRGSDMLEDSSKSSLAKNSGASKKAKSQMTMDEVLETQGDSSKVKSATSKTAIKVGDSSTARPKSRNLLKKRKKNRCRMKAEMERKRQKQLELDEHGSASESSGGGDEATGSQRCSLADNLMKQENQSDKSVDEEEKVGVVGLCPTPSFVSGPASKALKKMRVAQFRIINEMLYTSRSEKAEELFDEDRRNFHVYHEGYRHQVSKWLMNPLDRIISKIRESFPKTTRIADLGCGEAKLAVTLKPQGYTVHSFDLVAANEHVRECNIRDVPLRSESVDVAVMCLSLMGTDMGQFVLEANRILVANGELLIAEVESRIPSVDAFVKVMKRYGFTLKYKETARVFLFFGFRKSKTMPKGAEQNMDNVLWLKPCLYKKR